MNSYDFVERFNLTPTQPIPTGHRSTWQDRHHLAAVKLEAQLLPAHSDADWPNMLLGTDGHNRSQDQFIEAHIYEGFNAGAVENVRFAEDHVLSRQDKLDIEAIKDLLANHSKGAQP